LTRIFVYFVYFVVKLNCRFRVMLAYFWIAIGGALGSVARYWLSGAVAARSARLSVGHTRSSTSAARSPFGILAALAEPADAASSARRGGSFSCMESAAVTRRFPRSAFKPSNCSGPATCSRRAATSCCRFFSAHCRLAGLPARRRRQFNERTLTCKFPGTRCCCGFSSAKAIAGSTSRSMKPSF